MVSIISLEDYLFRENMLSSFLKLLKYFTSTSLYLYSFSMKVRLMLGLSILGFFVNCKPEKKDYIKEKKLFKVNKGKLLGNFRQFEEKEEKSDLNFSNALYLHLFKNKKFIADAFHCEGKYSAKGSYAIKDYKITFKIKGQNDLNNTMVVFQINEDHSIHPIKGSFHNCRDYTGSYIRTNKYKNNLKENLSKKTTGAQYVELANYYFENKKYSKVVSNLILAFKVEKKASYLYKISKVLIMQNRYSEALKYSKKATKLDSKNEDYMLQLGDIYYSMKNWKKAKKIYLIDENNRVGKLAAIEFKQNNIKKYCEYSFRHIPSLGHFFHEDEQKSLYKLYIKRGCNTSYKVLKL